MLFNGTLELTDFYNKSLGNDNPSTVAAGDLNTYNWGNNTGLRLYTHQFTCPSIENGEWYFHPPNVGGPSQPHVEVELLGGLDGSPHLDSATPPATLCPANWVLLDEGKLPCPPLRLSCRGSFIRHRTQLTFLPGHDRLRLLAIIGDNPFLLC